MFGFARKNNKNENVFEKSDDIVKASSFLEDDELAEEVSEEEILSALNEDAENGFNEDYIDMLEITEDGYTITEDESEEEQEHESAPETQVTEVIENFDALCDYVNSKPVGYIQYMRKENKEVFQIRESHLRIARVWGSVSMAREYSERDYARIMLALEILEAPDNFYVLPMFSDSEMQSAIMTFCSENFRANGKKYVKNTAKFAKFINDNGHADLWNDYTGSLMHLKLQRFCEKNQISFNTSENEDKADE